VKENEESLKIFDLLKIIFSKLINYLTNVCQSCQGTIVCTIVTKVDEITEPYIFCFLGLVFSGVMRNVLETFWVGLFRFTNFRIFFTARGGGTMDPPLCGESALHPKNCSPKHRNFAFGFWVNGNKLQIYFKTKVTRGVL
jgi:hypothetical protein